MASSKLRDPENMENLMNIFYDLLSSHPELPDMPKQTKDGVMMTLAEILLLMAGELAHEVNGNVLPEDVGEKLCLVFTGMVHFGNNAHLATFL